MVVRGAIAVPGRSPYPRYGARRSWLPLELPRLFDGQARNPWVRPAYRKRALHRRKALLALLVLAALLAASAVTVRLATHMDSVVVLAKRETPGMPEFFYQEDAAWSSDTLGDTDRTMGKCGDDVACLASLMSMQQLPIRVSGEINPGTLNAWLTENDAYDSDGGLIWSRVAGLLGMRAVEKQPQRGLDALMEALLQREIYPVVTVRRPDTGAKHEVLVVATVHGEFVIVDPLDPTGIPNSLSLYENRIYGLRYLENEEETT